MRKIRLNESQLNRIVSKCVKMAINEINSKNTLNVDAICQWAKQSADKLSNGDNACYFYPLGESNCKTNQMFLVLGWRGGFNEAMPNEPYADGEYRVCCKLAYNCDDLQCDYDFDWEMPYDENSGDVDDTDNTYDDSYVRYLLDHWKKNYGC